MLNRFSFAPAMRLRNKEQYDRVFSRRQRLFGKHYILYYLANDLDFPRLGILTSKRNVRRANKRNMFRRIAREQFRLQQQQLDSVDIVVIAKRLTQPVSKQELHECLTGLLNRLRQQLKSS